MMRDDEKSREQLIDEVSSLRHRVSELESALGPTPTDTRPAPVGDGLPPRPIEDRWLEDRHTHLAAILEATPDMVSTADLSGRILYFNRAARQTLGIGHEEDISKRTIPQSHPDWADELIRGEGIPTALREGVWFGETAVLDREGREIPVSQVIIAHRTPEGAVQYLSTIARDISREKRTEQQMRLMADSLPVLISYVDAGGRYRFVNRSYEEWFGHPREEVLGKTPEQLLGTAAYQVVREYLEAALAGQPVTYETLMPYRSGGARHISASLVPHVEEDGTVAGFFGLVTDISDRKRSQIDRELLLGEIGAQRCLLQAVVESVPVGIAVLRGPDLVYELVNPAYRSFAPGREMVGRPLAEVWPEMAEQVVPSVREILRTGRPHHYVDAPCLLRAAPDLPPEERYFTFDGLPLQISGDGADAVLVLISDTTREVLARRRIEELAEAVGRRAAELQSVLDNMVDAVFVADTRGQITLVNEACARMFGLDSVRDAERPAHELREMLLLRHPDGRPFAREDQVIYRALSGETVALHDSVVRNRRTGRDVYVRANASPIRDESGGIVGAVSVARDITELTELERLKDQFVAVAAHELKTPVAIMKGYAQLLLRKAEEIPASLRGMLRSIDVGADRIDRIVRELLDISRLQKGRLELSMERTDLLDLVQRVVDQMSLSTDRHRIRVVEGEAVAVRGDRDRLEQVMVNLVDNAIRYSPRGGDIEVAVAIRGRDAVVSVRDYGVGIPEAKKDRIFQRFYRAHTNTPYDYGGMGVSLYISREIVARHGGAMWFESEEGKGSSFSLSIPL